MTTDSKRWDLALRAHSAEHAAMRDRGLGLPRVGISGRLPRSFSLPSVPFGPRGTRAYGRGISGWDTMTTGSKLAIGVGGLTVLGLGLYYGLTTKSYTGRRVYRGAV